MHKRYWKYKVRMWLSLLTCMVILAVWIGGSHYRWGFSVAGKWVLITWGRLGIFDYPLGTEFRPTNWYCKLQFDFTRPTPMRSWDAFIPLWAFAIPAVFWMTRATAIYKRFTDVYYMRYCKTCNYERVGIAVTAFCPECHAPPHKRVRAEKTPALVRAGASMS